MSIQHPNAITDPQQTIHGRIEEMAKLYPEKEAIRFKDIALSYQSLNLKANASANQILQMIGTGKGQVAIYLEHGISQPLAILSILKAGKTYIALDPHFPVDRNLQMLENGDCSLVITNNMNMSQVRTFATDLKILNIDEAAESTSEIIARPDILPDQPAFITYTSGSTGIPKGVVHSHANILHFMIRMNAIECGMPEERWAYFYSLSFSAHALPLYNALLNGGTLCIFDLMKDNFADFSKWLKQEKILMNRVKNCLLKIYGHPAPKRLPYSRHLLK